ncbi:phytanoyl-CoA dioxygenase family protein [Mycobacterium arosiense]|uniref:Phytanoyl-CoA dioxygenase n=1 Tax=Mycobacterium arosiense ATCC BAA-1401 = DSM 45069 TaxID=1265311 RepID=A0A1W9Z7G3_MYCAI|nr:phytanoyl-CoA dioxygenase family protein [Mycobacterium arosiense]ORA08355.1 phytanoyl-CoA dioxygenase [Mycobacterium arosiense ATCC BAA-1401 = DSM 45069]
MKHTTILASPCRTVIPEEVDYLHEFGWVKLKNFVDPDVIHKMLAIARERMGDDADGPPAGPEISEASANEANQPPIAYFNVGQSAFLTDPVMRPLINAVGKNARLLQSRRRSDGSAVGVRYYADYFVPKLPSGKPSRNGGNGTTAYHQDFITFSVDRSGGLTFWFPLEAYGPQAGTMSFVNGSHRAGVLGDYTTYGDGDALDVFPELRDLGISEQMTYELGDISVHTHLTIHGAGLNTMDRPRWGYLLATQPADVCWNGSPTPNFDSTGMRPWQPLDDERFPLIG